MNVNVSTTSRRPAGRWLLERRRLQKRLAGYARTDQLSDAMLAFCRPLAGPEARSVSCGSCGSSGCVTPSGPFRERAHTRLYPAPQPPDQHPKGTDECQTS